MSTTIKVIQKFFDEYNISIDMVYVDRGGKPCPELEMTFEDSCGQTVYLDHFWEGRIKAYNLLPKGENNEKD